MADRRGTELNAMNLILRAMIACFILMRAADLLASDAGSRGSYTRGGWVGAKYVAMGRTAEVIVDDVYSIYWNPAGLTELRHTQLTTEGEIKDLAQKGKVDEIKESDLIKFSEEDKSFSVQVGITGALLDVERNAGFVGAAINLPKGVLGIGLYSILSQGIDRRDFSGVKTGELMYAGSAFYLSYGVSLGVASFGVTAKALYEKIGNSNYMGGAVDIGTQVYVLPFLKIGFLVQDLGGGLYPLEERLGVRQKYDLGYPTLRLGIALITNRNFTLSLSGIKHLEQKSFGYGIGIQYDITKWASVYLGMQNLAFSTGMTLHIVQFDVSYALTIDNIDNGYNHIVSISFLF
ncbi:MAG: hypothetical protein A2176_03105 [Spirochaetes bacterium RBG_13_51_14]|nr:MAG: hypothetical protein A2176_03105 [Spirochaetes bacterium RBG_13_51_14]